MPQKQQSNLKVNGTGVVIIEIACLLFSPFLFQVIDFLCYKRKPIFLRQDFSV